MTELAQATPMSSQQVFDKVAKHLLIQNKRSDMLALGENGNPTSICVYRSLGGLRCGIGWLIPDEMYTAGMEGVRVHGLLQVYSNLRNLFESDATPIMGILQEMHDDKVVEDWPRILKNIACNYNLDDSIVDATLKERDADASV